MKHPFQFSLQLSLNISKTNFLHFKKSKHDLDITLNFAGKKLDKPDHVKFLGIIIDSKLNWKNHIDYISNKLNSGVYAIRKLKLLLPRSVLRTLYFALIESHLVYGLTVWGGTFPSYLKSIKVIQKKCVRIICNKQYNSPTAELFKELNILNFDKLYKLYLCKLMFRFITDDLPNSLKTMFILNNNIHNYNTRNRNEPHIQINKCTPYCQSFLHKSPIEWLTVNDDIKNSNNKILFNKRLKRFLINLD